MLSVMPGIPTFHWKKDRFFFRVPVECDSSISGAFIRRHTLYGENQLALAVESGQTVFLMGADGGVCGAVGSSGRWWGTDSVTAQPEDGRVVLTVSQSCSGEILLISAQQFSIE